MEKLMLNQQTDKLHDLVSPPPLLPSRFVVLITICPVTHGSLTGGYICGCPVTHGSLVAI